MKQKVQQCYEEETLIAKEKKMNLFWNTARIAMLWVVVLLLAGCGDFEWFPDGSKPKPFSFTSQSGVAVKTLVESNAITVTGNSYSTTISVANGEYKIDSNAYTSASGKVSAGQKVTVRHTSASTYDTSTTTTLTIGGVSAGFTSVTLAAPAFSNVLPFSFTSKLDVEQSTLVESEPATISGTSDPWAIKVTNGEYSLDGGAYTNLDGTISNQQVVKVRHTSGSTASTQTTTTLQIENLIATFVSVTKATSVFSSYSTPTAVVSSGNITVTPPLNAVVNLRDTSGVNFSIKFTAANSSGSAKNVRFILAGLDNKGRKIHPGYFTFFAPLDTGTRTVTQSIGTLPLATYDSITTWVFRQIDVI